MSGETGMAYFTIEGETFVPLPLAASLWSERQMHGVAVSGVLAREAERVLRTLGRGDLTPARYRVDLFKAAAMVPSKVSAHVIRQGPRLVLIDVELLQDDVPVARASVTYVLASGQPAGQAWQDDDQAVAPSLDEVPAPDGPRPPYWHSLKPWSQDFLEHQNSGRHSTWQVAVPIVAGEASSPFVALAAIADTTSMVTHWSEAGIEWINTDISLAMTRRPTGLEIGIRSRGHLSHAGVAVGTAELFDRDGVLGTATVTALANTRRTVNFEDHPELGR